jgi:hypothetical protein
MPDLESDSIRDAYWKQLRELTPRFPPAMVRLAEISLHDAVIEQIRWNAGEKRLRIRLAALNTDETYSTVELRYEGAMLGDRRIETLREVARDREATILYDELDIDEEGILSHRLLFWPRDEVSLDFRELEINVTPRADTRVQLAGYFIEECDEKE